MSFDVASLPESLSKLECCVKDIQNWMTSNLLCLNADKTEFLLLTPRNSNTNLENITIQVGNENIKTTPLAKNIGVFFDKHFLLHEQVTHVARSAWYALRRIGQIRPFLNQTAAERVIHAFISSRLDQNYSLLHGISDCHMKKLRRVQYASDEVLLRQHPMGSMSPILSQLHWLSISQRVEYKILLLVYKCLNGYAPAYLAELIKLKDSTRHLRSNSQCMLETPKSGQKMPKVTYGDRSFTMVAPRLWNVLPPSVKLQPSIDSFKVALKTHLFKCAFLNI